MTRLNHIMVGFYDKICRISKILFNVYPRITFFKFPYDQRHRLRNEYGRTVGKITQCHTAVAENISGRCVKCYEMRLFETAKTAKENGFDSFTSSLFISPYQNHELMRETAERAAMEYGVEFLYRDFREYFHAGQDKARELGFYMQKYCGCIFSEEERYIKAKKILP